MVLRKYIDDNNLSTKYIEFFNYGLNPDTWHLFVNKQIHMKAERLFIEKQLNDIKSKENIMRAELANLKKEIEKVKADQIVAENYPP